MVRVFFILTLLLMEFSACLAVEPALLAWYRFGGNLKDSSGHNRDLKTISGNMSFSEAKEIGEKCLLPGKNQGAAGPVLPFSTEKGFTVCGFVSLPENNSYQADLFGCGSSEYGRPGAMLSAPWGVLNVKVGSGKNREFKRFNDSRWHHYALVVSPAASASEYLFYVDGKKVFTEKFSSSNNYGPISLGRVSGKQWKGIRLADIRYYDGVLSAGQIKKLASKTAGAVKLTNFHKSAGETADNKPGLWSKAVSKVRNYYVSKNNQRRIVPEKYDFPLQGELKVHFLDNQWICIVGNYNNFIRRRFRIECGDFLLKLDRGEIKVPDWSYDFHYNFGTVEVLSDYRPKLKKKFESPDTFILRNKIGKRIKFSRNSYWINAIGQMRVPVIASGKMKMVKAAAVAHFAYLKLEKPLQNGMSYTVTTADREKLTFVYDDKKIISRAIKVNQIGYLPEAGRKFGYLGMWLGPAGNMDFPGLNKKPFYLIDEKTGDRVFTGRIWPRMREQYFTAVKGMKVPINGEVVYDLEFSPFDKPGRYYIYIPGVGRSWSFAISHDAVGRAFFTHIRGLFHQRSGIRKAPPQTNWKMGANHMTTWVGGFSPEDSDYNTLRKDGCGYLDQYGKPVKIDHFTVVEETATDKALPHVNGGWWDAGDFDRRTYHFRIVQDLLSAYFMFPENFSDGQLHIPESGNGIPDIIDEAAWGVDLWRRAQNSKGGVGCWIEADSHPKVYNPAKDTQRYYLALPTRHSTMLYAAHAALLARAFLKCGAKEKSELFKSSAVKAFNYAINPDNRIVHRFRHRLESSKEYVTYTYREPPGLDKAVLFKAAYNLAVLTNDRHYDTYASRANFEVALRQSDYPNTPFFMTEVCLGLRDFPDFAVAAKKQIMEKALEWLHYQELQAYRTLTFPANHVFFRNLAWGNAIPFNKGRYFIMAYRISGAYKYRDAALLLNDWLHGANPMGRSLPTGTGVNYPVRILSLPSYADGILEPMPGITPYTYTFEVDYNVKNMVYALRYPPRQDHNFAGTDICLMPEAVSKGKKMTYRQISNAMDKFYPVWRRFGNIEQYAVEQNEFTVWETIGPCAACLGALIPPGWKPPENWQAPVPKESLDEMEGYLFQP